MLGGDLQKYSDTFEKSNCFRYWKQFWSSHELLPLQLFLNPREQQLKGSALLCYFYAFMFTHPFPLEPLVLVFYSYHSSFLFQQ